MDWNIPQTILKINKVSLLLDFFKVHILCHDKPSINYQVLCNAMYLVIVYYNFRGMSRDRYICCST